MSERVVVCAHCKISLPRADAKKCSLCDMRKVATPSYYCSTICAKRDWKNGHKVWHRRQEHTANRTSIWVSITAVLLVIVGVWLARRVPQLQATEPPPLNRPAGLASRSHERLSLKNELYVVATDAWDMAAGNHRNTRMVPKGQAPANIHGSYEFTVKIQCSLQGQLMMYDERKSFTIGGIENEALLTLCREHGIAGKASHSTGGKKYYLSALRDEDDILVFTDKVLPEPDWGITKKLSHQETRRYSAG